jgi:hypothetical protein
VYFHGLLKSFNLPALDATSVTMTIETNSYEHHMQIPASPMPDIDSKDLNDHLECAEYASNIFEFFRRMEPTIQVDCEYMNRQRYITRQMRAVLIDWIVDVHAKFKVRLSTSLSELKRKVCIECQPCCND